MSHTQTHLDWGQRWSMGHQDIRAIFFFSCPYKGYSNNITKFVTHSSSYHKLNIFLASNSKRLYKAIYRAPSQGWKRVRNYVPQLKPKYVSRKTLNIIWTAPYYVLQKWLAWNYISIEGDPNLKPGSWLEP